MYSKQYVAKERVSIECTRNKVRQRWSVESNKILGTERGKGRGLNDSVGDKVEQRDDAIRIVHIEAT